MSPESEWMLGLKSYCLVGKCVIQLTVNNGLAKHDKVPPPQCIFYYVPDEDLFLWPSSAHKCVASLLYNSDWKLYNPAIKLKGPTIKIHDLTSQIIAPSTCFLIFGSSHTYWLINTIQNSLTFYSTKSFKK